MENNVKVLHEAVLNRDIHLIRELIGNGIDLKTRNSEGLNCLHLAVEKGLSEIVKQLLEADSSLISELVLPEHKSSNNEASRIIGYSVLHFTAKRGHMKITELLLSYGAKVDVIDENKRMPIHVAGYYGCTRFVKLMVSHGSPIDVKDSSGKTALMYAVEEDHLQLVTFFLNMEGVVEENSNLIRLLQLAVINSSVSVAEYLLYVYKINVTEPLKYGRTYLHLCLLPKSLALDEHVKNSLKRENSFTNEDSKLRMFKLLLLSNVDINAVCDEGLTVYHIIAALGYCVIAHYIYVSNNFVKSSTKIPKIDYTTLLNHQANNGKTPLMYAVECYNEAIVRLLLSVNANVETCNFYGKSVVEIASESSSVQIVQLLLNKCKELNLYEKYFMQAVHCAVKKKKVPLSDSLLKSVNISLNVENMKVTACVKSLYDYNINVVRFLISYGYPVRFEDLETTAHLAVGQNYDDILDSCLQNGVNVDCKSLKGDSLLFVICLHQKMNAARRCIELGCDVNFKNCSGNTALHAAVYDVNPTLVRLLIESGCDVYTENDKMETPFILFLKNLTTSHRLHVNGRLSNDLIESNHKSIITVGRMLYKPTFKLSCNENNTCILYLAVRTNIVELVKMVIKKHPHFEFVDKSNGRTCMHLAAEYNCVKAMKILLESGAHPDPIDDSQDWPITIGMKKTHLEIVRLLMNWSNFNDYRNLKMRTVLHLAAVVGNPDITSFFINMGADLHLLDVEGKSAVCYGVIVSRNPRSVVRYFLNKGFNVNNLCHKNDCPCTQHFYTLKFFHLHLVKLYLIGCHLRPNYVKLVEKMIDSNKLKVIAEIKLEAERLKATFIPGTNIPYINVIKLSENNMAKLVGNENVIKTCVKEDSLKTLWPYYWRILNNNIVKGFVRRKLFDKCQEIFYAGVLTQGKLLPQYCVSFILEHLENSQLHTFIVAFPFVDTSEFDEHLFIDDRLDFI